MFAEPGYCACPPRAVHCSLWLFCRLDKETTGVMLLARNADVAWRVHGMFRRREVRGRAGGARVGWAGHVVGLGGAAGHGAGWAELTGRIGRGTGTDWAVYMWGGHGTWSGWAERQGTGRAGGADRAD